MQQEKRLLRLGKHFLGDVRRARACRFRGEVADADISGLGKADLEIRKALAAETPAEPRHRRRRYFGADRKLDDRGIDGEFEVRNQNIGDPPFRLRELPPVFLYPCENIHVHRSPFRQNLSLGSVTDAP
ncbi:hypothetical protein D3C72_1562260 [compost metagenome]